MATATAIQAEMTFPSPAPTTNCLYWQRQLSTSQITQERPGHKDRKQWELVLFCSLKPT